MNQRIKSTLFLLGRPISPLYSLVMRSRAYFYSKNLFTTHELDVPVISIGNLTMGGTGKTPLVIHLAEFLAQMGFKPAIVSRGYHGSAKKRVNIVSDGKKLLMDARSAGDEPILIATRVPSIVVATGKKRIFPCLEVVERFHCDVIILDDGFQHLSLSRNLDLVLFGVDHFAGNSRVFPGGDLREPVSALHRCDAFLLTGITPTNKDRTQKCTELLQDRFPDKEVFTISATYSNWVKHTISSDGISREFIGVSELPDNLFGFCGIGQPNRFFDMIKQQSISIVGRRSFADHHAYSPGDISALFTLAEKADARGFLTTEKDVIKLGAKHHSPLPFYTPVLDIETNDKFKRMVLDRVTKI